jgi:hypothetical protein
MSTPGTVRQGLRCLFTGLVEEAIAYPGEVAEAAMATHNSNALEVDDRSDDHEGHREKWLRKMAAWVGSPRV